MNILLNKGHILTMEGDSPQVIQGCVGIRDDKIVFAGTAPEDFKADRIIDASDSLIMPGLVNAHTHISMSLFRHYADDLDFWDWLFGRILPVEEKLTAEDAYWGAMLGLCEMIRGGITCFADMYMFMDRVASAAETSGIRARLSRGLTFSGPEDLAKLDQVREVHKNWHGRGQGRIAIDIAPHAIYTCPPEYLEKCTALSRELDTCIHIHLSESRKEVADCYEQYGKSPVALLRDIGLFSRKTYAAHCVHLSDEDMDILKEYKVGVMNNPCSNMKLGNGFAPVRRLLEKGVTVALGSDGPASNNNLSIFEEMNLAALVNKGVEENSTVVSAYTALKMATIDGAKVLGLDHITGSIKEGKKADLIMIDLNVPHFFPRNNLVAGLVYAGQGSDVKTLICNGKIIMEDRKILTLDEKEIFREAEACCRRLIPSV
ncbi:N-ethylammeline chlorohydrolase [candidate division KSB3 bacterium]|uniref:5-methylthioadenosine/S-adenosylhomocysteine deaminase n=1 Tax=candidate division KSB3 bacterium TaxID=2044937 RepID=A0A2G6E199_9BACT|nr:MAG: N-ethylammeline chlorohydrolase [candidate division KSB3 bacterium]